MAPTVRDPLDNLTRLETAAISARRDGASILVAPELALTGYDIGELGEPETSADLLEQVCRVARRAGLAIVIGLAEVADGRTWNSSVIVDRAGQVRASYRKTHLFGALDRSRFGAGEELPPVVELDGIAVSTLVCYDIEFPEPARIAAVRGADVLAVPTANMQPWTFVNDHIVPVRAFENQLYVGYANHCGTERDTRYVGGSLIAAPDGSTVRAGADDEEIILSTIDTAFLAERRREATYLRDRRPELYAALSEETP